jgi:hypothetical protein
MSSLERTFAIASVARDDDARDATGVDFTDVSPALDALDGFDVDERAFAGDARLERLGVARWARASDVQRSRWRGFHPRSADARQRSDGLHGRANRAIALRWRALCACIC